MSGVGNWVADEVCYQARVHPASPCYSLSDLQITDVHTALGTVLRVAVDVNAESEAFPSDWLFHFRWSKGKGGGGETAKDAGGRRIEFLDVGGRTSAVVSSIQKKGQREAMSGGKKDGVAKASQLSAGGKKEKTKKKKAQQGALSKTGQEEDGSGNGHVCRSTSDSRASRLKSRNGRQEGSDAAFGIFATRQDSTKRAKRDAP